MGSPEDLPPALQVDWLGLSRRASAGALEALERYPLARERSETTGRGEGGDMALVIDRAVEDVVFAELESLGEAVTAISEERGEVAIAGGGPVHVIIDPIDGSLNAKRGLPFYSLSIAVGNGRSMRDVAFGYVNDLSSEEEWWARQGEGAFAGDHPIVPLDPGAGLEVLGIESAQPDLLVDAADALAATGASRVRALGSIALTLCQVAAGRLDAMLSLAPCRSVDAAAGQLIVREAGGGAAFPDASADPLGASLDLDMRSRVIAAGDRRSLEALTGQVFGAPAADTMAAWRD